MTLIVKTHRTIGHIEGVSLNAMKKKWMRKIWSDWIFYHENYIKKYHSSLLKTKYLVTLAKKYVIITVTFDYIFLYIKLNQFIAQLLL